MEKISSWHMGVASEAYAATLFARFGYDVSVQYGANQPEYDLIATKGDKMLKISVKGGQDGSWGLTQSYKKGCSYYDAIDKWLEKHHRKTIFRLVQLKDTAPDEMPRMYLASPDEIAQRMKDSAGGRGETILYEHHVWGPRAAAAGTVEAIPDTWSFTARRAEEMFEKYGQE